MNRSSKGADLAARAFLTVASLLPYWRLLTFGVVYVTDDYFASDIFNGELGGRVLIGRMLRSGHLPVWTSSLCSGVPLTGGALDPIGLAAFTFLRPAAALDALVVVLLLVAAHGAYDCARRFGADRPGSVLAGIAYAGSGYIACQLKHLAIVSTVVWLPVGIALLDRGLSASDARATPARRALFIAAFGLVFAEQALCGFPQSAYICGLAYAAFACFRAGAGRWRLWRSWLQLLAATGLAALLGAAVGAVILLPLAQLGTISDRAATTGWIWSTGLAYWPRNALTFLVPYINGDIADNTYVGSWFFWEDYGYVGVLTFLLACYGAVREWRRPVIAFVIVMTVLAYFFVLGVWTPVFRIAWLIIPGMKLFRFPTRFLIVVELGIAVLGGVGLTRLRAELGARSPSPSRRPLLVAVSICLMTTLDLFIHQPRQNPMVSARDWLAPPRSVAILHDGASPPRTFTPRHRDVHRIAFQVAHGWADVTPYYDLRDVLEPNTGGAFWDTPSADCYAGVSARWYVDVWGDHNREASLMASLSYVDVRGRVLQAAPVLANVLRSFGVTHVLSTFPQTGTALAPLGREGKAWIYRVDDAARVRIVRAARPVTTDRDAMVRLVDPSFDPNDEILLHDVAGQLPSSPVDDATPLSTSLQRRAVITREDGREIAIDAEAPADAFLLLADTYYPGWTAEVDGVETPVYRANVSVRGIRLPKGHHVVRFAYDPPGFTRGLQVTIAALALLLLWIGGAAYAVRVRR